MRTIVETLASEVPVSVRPYLAIVIGLNSNRIGLTESVALLHKRFARMLLPDGPDEKLTSVAAVLDRFFAESDEEKLNVYWDALSHAGVADSVMAALDIAPSYIARLARASRAAAATPGPSVH